MNKTLLQQLYSGEVYPAEKIIVRTPEYKKLNHKISDDKEYFQSALSANDWERFDKYSDMELQRSSAYAFENFVYGFRLAVGLMIEILDTTTIHTEE